MLEVGVDTFISIEDADKFVEENYLYKPTLYNKWKELSVEQKEACLRRNTRILSRLRYDGKKLNYSQPLPFPRVRNFGIGGYIAIPYISQFYDNQHLGAGGNTYDQNGMGAIGRATIINALYDVTYNDVIDSVIQDNIKGLSSKKVGPVSENYNRSNYKMYSMETGIYTKEVETELKDWLINAKLSV